MQHTLFSLASAEKLHFIYLFGIQIKLNKICPTGAEVLVDTQKLLNFPFFLHIYKVL